MLPEILERPAAADNLRLLNALRRCERRTDPFDHWLFEDMLADDIVEGVAGLAFAPPPRVGFDGRRETNNSARTYFDPINQAKSPAVRKTVALFAEAAVVARLCAICGVDLAKGRLRIEYCQDVDGFWLEPHLDISAKLMTLLIYLSDDPNLANAGTDLYDASPEHRPSGRAAYRRNAGLLFVPGADTWHGFSPRPIQGLRKSLIVNYVTPDWRSVEELAFP